MCACVRARVCVRVRACACVRLCDAGRKKQRGFRKRGSASNMFRELVVVFGNDIKNNRTAAADLTDLIEVNGGKVQATVTKKVTHLVFSSKTASVSSSDARVKSALKHEAHLVFDTFFIDSAARKTVLNEEDYKPDVSSSGKAPGKRQRRADSEDSGEGSGSASEGEDKGEQACKLMSKQVRAPARACANDCVLDRAGDCV